MISFYVFEIGMTKNCSYLSKHWHKRCGLSSHCAHKCRKLLEGAVDGVCSGSWSSKCYCFFNECPPIVWWKRKMTLICYLISISTKGKYLCSNTTKKWQENNIIFSICTYVILLEYINVLCLYVDSWYC